MRTTLNIDDIVLSVIRIHADRRAISLGEAASELAQGGDESLPHFRQKDGLVIFDAAEGQALNDEAVKNLERVDADEEYQGAFSPRR